MNVTQYLAQYVASSYGTDVRVYSNVDPTRAWDGTPTAEFGEQEASTTWFISGASETKRNFIFCARAQTQETSDAFLAAIKPTIRAACDALVMNGDSVYWEFDETDSAPDVRGVVVGESFYSCLKFYIIERTEFNE